MEYDVITIGAKDPENAAICGYNLLYMVKGEHSIYSLNHASSNFRLVIEYGASHIEDEMINNWFNKTKSIVTGTPTDLAGLDYHPLIKRIHHYIPDDRCFDYSGQLQEIHDKIRKN